MSIERLPCTTESMADCRQLHHLHRIEVAGEAKIFVHLEHTSVNCDEFVRIVSTPPVRGKACHFLSKKQHVLHRVKWGRHQIRQHLAAGLGANPHTGVGHQEALAQHDAAEAEAQAMEEKFHCSMCGDVFDPKPYPNNEHATIFANTIILPGGKFLKPDHTPDGQPMELPRAICPMCVKASKFVETAEHDWDVHDHLAQPLSKGIDP